ncbi:MAG TPA: hypothetical protein VF092_02045 [Longimicrobium sp.]
MRRYPGEVWFLPPDAQHGGDSKARRHVLLTTCEDAGDIGVFAYASTQPTEANFGAASLLVVPGASRYDHSGFSKPTYVYPGRLVPAVSEDFLRMVGRLIDEMPELRRLLRKALGFGTGTSLGQGSAAGSWRGRVVEIGAVLRQYIGYAHGVVLTEPEYSRQARYQVIVPIDDIRAFEPAADDLVITDAEWFRELDSEMPAALVAIADVQSVFHPAEIVGWTGVVVDDATIARIEAALAALFAL